MRYLSYIRNFFLPSYCLYCRNFIEPEAFLCDTCTNLIELVPSYTLSLVSGDSVIVHALSSYKDPIKPLVLAKKRSDYRASCALAHLIWQRSLLHTISFDYIVPIPLHWTRYAIRGYNQTEVMARQLSSLSRKKVLKGLIRKRHTRFQSELSPQERKQNVTDSFLYKGKESCKGKTLILVDDLMTTGATLQAVAQELAKQQPERILAFVACRVM